MAGNSSSEDGLLPVSSVLSGYSDGYRLVRGRQADAIEQFVLLGTPGSPRLLLPLAKPLTNSAINGFLGGRSLSKLLPLLVRFSVALGGPFTKICGEYSLIASDQSISPIRKLLTDILGRDDFQIALRFSFRRPNGKTVALAISNDGEIPVSYTHLTLPTKA